MPSRRIIIVSALAAVPTLIVGLVGWVLLLLPTSFAEYEFRERLSIIAVSGQSQVPLASLYPSSEWEVACDSHGYDGDLWLAKYNRTYPSAAPPQDGVWGLIFIRPDGSYTPVVGSCNRGRAMLRLKGCASRATTLTLQVRNSACPQYERGEG